MDFTDSTQEILDTLRVMNFLNINDNKVSITESGREFIG
jgi:predicted methyltransferase